MKKNKWIACIFGMILVLQTPIMAQVDESTFSFVQTESFFISPLQDFTTILAPFGEVRGGYTHQGIDIKAENGTPIYAIADGTITKAAPDSKGVDKGGGHMIFIDHGDGMQSWYMHLSAYAVATGEKVKRGQIIGFTGNSGDSTAPLLHFEYRISGEPLDPQFIFEANKVVCEALEPIGGVEIQEDNFLAIQS